MMDFGMWYWCLNHHKARYCNVLDTIIIEIPCQINVVFNGMGFVELIRVDGNVRDYTYR